MDGPLVVPPFENLAAEGGAKFVKEFIISKEFKKLVVPPFENEKMAWRGVPLVNYCDGRSRYHQKKISKLFSLRIYS